MDDSAVSPVIGVVILVGIVVLSVVAGSIFFGFGDSIEGSSTAGVRVEDGSATLTDLGDSKKSDSKIRE